ALRLETLATTTAPRFFDAKRSMAVVLPMPGGPAKTEILRRSCVDCMRAIRRRATLVATYSVIAPLRPLKMLRKRHFSGALQLGGARRRGLHAFAPDPLSPLLQFVSEI